MNNDNKKSQAEIWNDCLMTALRTCGLRIKLKRKYPKFPGKYLTKERQFLQAAPGILIGTLGWDRIEDPSFAFVPRRTKLAVAFWLQEEITKYGHEKNWPFKIVIEPHFADVPQEQAKPSPFPIPGIRPQVLQVPYICTKPRYLARSSQQTSRVIKIDRERYIKMEAIGEPIFDSDGNPSEDELRIMPWGVMCTQVEIWMFNYWRMTNSLFVFFDSPSEILDQIGFYGTANQTYKRFLNCIRDMTWCTQKIVTAGESRVLDITPIEGYNLWDKLPARIDKLGRRNPGRRKIPIDQRELYPSFWVINDAWAKTVGSAYEKVDLTVLNQLTSSPIQYALALRVYEWGSREESCKIPLWGANGECEALGLKGRKNARRTIRLAFEAVKRLTGCPHELANNEIITYPWDPFRGKPQHKITLPRVTEKVLTRGLPTKEELENQKDATLRYLAEKIGQHK